MRVALIVLALSAATCAAPRVPGYSERCTDPAHPCGLAYDFEPSGAARDVFAPPDAQPQFLLVNEDGTLFRWILGEKSPWDHDNVKLVRPLGEVLQKVESAASAVCDGTPVFLAAASYMPGRKGRSPKRERVVALAGSLDAPPRILEKTSAAIAGIAAHEKATSARIEGLALAPDCRTLYVGVRTVTTAAGDVPQPTLFPVALDVDWKGTKEEATLGEPLPLTLGSTCSGQPEGISALETLSDGSLLALTSYEKELAPRKNPEDVAQGELAGSLWKRTPDGRTTRLACFPGHKPESLAVDADEKHVRVVFEDDDYGGRPIGVYAVKVALP